MVLLTSGAENWAMFIWMRELGHGVSSGWIYFYPLFLEVQSVKHISHYFIILLEVVVNIGALRYAVYLYLHGVLTFYKG